MRNAQNPIRGRERFLVFGSPAVEEDEIEEVVASLRSGWLGTGPKVERFENDFKTYKGAQHAVAVSSCTAALHLSLVAAGIRPGDEVITSALTFCATVNAIIHAGAKPVLADVSASTMNIDPEQVEAKITSRTRVVVPVHFAGRPCEMDEICEIAKRHHFLIIEDCAHAAGAECKGLKVGNLGDVAFYSSERSKIFNTIHGGLATTNDDEIGRKLKAYWEQSPYPDEAWIDRQLSQVILSYYQSKHATRRFLGPLFKMKYGQKRLDSVTWEEEHGVRPSYYGRKMPAAVAALGLNQLKKIDRYNGLRKQAAEHWNNWCERNHYRKPLVVEHSAPVYLRYPVLVEPEKKRDTSWARRELGVEIGVWFVSNLHPAPLYAEGCPNADRAVERCINFPTLGVSDGKKFIVSLNL